MTLSLNAVCSLRPILEARHSETVSSAAGARRHTPLSCFLFLASDVD